MERVVEQLAHVRIECKMHAPNIFDEKHMKNNDTWNVAETSKYGNTKMLIG